MATFDQLGPRQRAIIELLIRRGQTYDEISGMLGMPVPRVRELARDALVELAPSTADRVDPQWRGQLADFILGQQTGPESRATEGHLESSEDARIWALSLVDSLDALYEDGARPVIPPAAPPRSSRRRRRRGAESGDGEASTREPGVGEEETAEATRPSRGTATRERTGGARGRSATDGTRERRPLRPSSRRAEETRARAGGAVGEPTARRQRSLAIAAGVVVLALVVGGVVYALVSDGGDDQAAAPAAPQNQPGGQQPPGPGGQPPGGNQPAGGQPRVIGQIPLEALPGEEGEGRAVLAEQQGERAVVIEARGIEGVDEDELLEVWFYNNRADAKSIGAQRVQRGAFQGLGTLPPDWQRYRFIDVSRERADQNARHSGSSVLRGETRAAQAGVPQTTP